jgi:5-oxoprolinase (ATP-hydrolysing)/N-methylhydantoinase B
VELIERHGVDAFNELADQIKNVSELLVRRAISAMPDGEYAAEGYLEDDGVVGDKQHKFTVTLVIRGDEIIVDYTGSDPQAAGAINQSFGTTASATYATIFHMIDESIAKNHGAYRPISIVAPPGTVVNVNYPGSCVGGNSDTYPNTMDVLFAAFSQFSDRSTAADGGTSGLLGFYGKSSDSGNPFVLLHIEGMGWGGRADSDGNDAIVTKNGNCLNSPCEVFEVRYPVRIESYRIADGSPGVGEHRGGHGVERIWRCLAPITVSAHLNHLEVRPWGLKGGGPADNTYLLFQRAAEEKWKTARELFGTLSNGKFSNVQLLTGDQILLKTPGGGGYGNPLDRAPEKVHRDTLDGLIDISGAADAYGVVIEADLASVDLQATAQLRKAMRDAAS